jgi:DNA-binding transcriptional ArsR family regulator
LIFLVLFLLHPASREVTGGTLPNSIAGYNIFIMTNISPFDQVADLLQVIGQPARLQILLAIGDGESCVCHLEATFGWRQAYLSQHLMALREAGLVTDRRESRYIFYHLSDPRLLEVLDHMAGMMHVTLPELKPSQTCNCPNCTGQGTCCS